MKPVQRVREHSAQGRRIGVTHYCAARPPGPSFLIRLASEPLAALVTNARLRRRRACLRSPFAHRTRCPALDPFQSLLVPVPNSPCAHPHTKVPFSAGTDARLQSARASRSWPPGRQLRADPRKSAPSGASAGSRRLATPRRVTPQHRRLELSGVTHPAEFTVRITALCDRSLRSCLSLYCTFDSRTPQTHQTPWSPRHNTASQSLFHKPPLRWTLGVRTHRTTVGQRPTNMTLQPSFCTLVVAVFQRPSLTLLASSPHADELCIRVLNTSNGKVACTLLAWNRILAADGHYSQPRQQHQRFRRPS